MYSKQMSKCLRFYRLVGLVFSYLVLFLMSQFALAQDFLTSDVVISSPDNVIQIPLALPPNPAGVVPDGAASGNVAITNNPNGRDQISVYASGLEPNTRFTVFLTNSRTLGALPAQFIGEFRTDGFGSGSLFLSAEVVNAFATVGAGNTAVVDQFAAGAIANGTTAVPLDWIRIYRASTNGAVNSIFGGSENEIGGGNVLTSVRPIRPNNIIEPGVCNLDNDTQFQVSTVFIFQFDDDGNFSNFLSTGFTPDEPCVSRARLTVNTSDPVLILTLSAADELISYGDQNKDGILDVLPGITGFPRPLSPDIPTINLFDFQGGVGVFDFVLDGQTLKVSATPVF